MGHEDRFLRYLNSAWRRCYFGYYPYWKKGERTIKAPISVHDLATAVMHAFRTKHVRDSALGAWAEIATLFDFCGELMIWTL